MKPSHWKNIQAAFSLEHESLVLGQILTINRLLNLLNKGNLIQDTGMSMQHEHFIDKHMLEALLFPVFEPIFP